MESIVSSIQKLAFYIRLAAALTQGELTRLIKEIEALLGNQKNFVPVEGNPLQFSPEGLKEVQKLGYSPRITKDIPSLFKILNNAITLAGHTGNQQMAYLAKLLEKDPEKWSKLDLKSVDFNSAKYRALKALDFVRESADKPLPESSGKLSPEELQEMKEKGVI